MRLGIWSGRSGTACVRQMQGGCAKPNLRYLDEMYLLAYSMVHREPGLLVLVDSIVWSTPYGRDLGERRWPFFFCPAFLFLKSLLFFSL